MGPASGLAAGINRMFLRGKLESRPDSRTQLRNPWCIWNGNEWRNMLLCYKEVRFVAGRSNSIAPSQSLIDVSKLFGVSSKKPFNPPGDAIALLFQVEPWSDFWVLVNVVQVPNQPSLGVLYIGVFRILCNTSLSVCALLRRLSWIGKIPPILPPPRHSTYESEYVLGESHNCLIFTISSSTCSLARARAQKNRWSEEFTLVQYEMTWRVN